MLHVSHFMNIGCYSGSTPDRDLTSGTAGRGRGFGELHANGTFHATKRRLHRHKPPALVLFRGAAPDSDSEDFRVASAEGDRAPGRRAGAHSALASEPGPSRGLGLGAVPVQCTCACSHHERLNCTRRQLSVV